MSWTETRAARRRGERPHFIGDNESQEAYAERMAPEAAAQAQEAEDFAAFRAMREAERAAADQAAQAEAEAQAAARAEQAAAAAAAAAQGVTPGA